MPKKTNTIEKTIQGYKDAAEAIIKKAESEGRDLTDAEQKSFDEAIDNYDRNVENVKRATERTKRLSFLSSSIVDDSSEFGEKHLNFKGTTGRKFARNIASSIREAISDNPTVGKKAGQVLTQPVWANGTDEIVGKGQPVLSLIQALITKQVDQPTYIYLRQTVRDLQASVVLPGATKPASDIQVERIDSQLRVIAHLSSPVDKYLLEDTTSLAGFLQQEMQYGIEEKLEDLIVNGTGVDEPLGLLTVEGTTAVPFATDVLITLRRAKTVIETAGYVPGLFIINPDDWESIETMRTADSKFYFDGPVNVAARQVWGVPVAVTSAIAQGTGILIDPTAAAIYTDTQGVRTDWDGSGELFAKNQVRVRVEGRYDTAVTQPAAVARIALTSTEE